ncbi:MAG: hypothetical protein K1Y02_17770 [Candidatus Hydrogenedentes bacterium]|nr:hypothetical protein [Candidatus Hydrogenedentota bacterium]
MYTRTRVSGWRLAMLGIGVAALVVCSPMSFAQAPGGGGPGGPGGPQFSPEQMAGAWATEAKAVGKELGLADDLSAKLVDAYKAARESQMNAVRAKRSEAGGQRGPGGMEAMRELNDAEAGKLATALKAFLKEDQVAKAMTTLGSFSFQWDIMTVVLGDMKLDDAKSAEAAKIVLAYIADSSKLREEVRAKTGADREAMRESMREKMTSLKKKLDEDLGKVLSAEQLSIWSEKTTMRGGRGRFGGGAGPVPGAPTAPPAPPAPPAPAPK